MKKISSIVLYSILSLLIIAVILTGCIQKSFMPDIKIPAKATSGIQIDEEATAIRYLSLSNEKEYDSFVKKFNGGFKMSVLYALLSGKADEKVNISRLAKNTSPTYSGYKVTFTYADSQTLMENGKVYYYATNSTSTVEYTKLTFSVNEDKGLAKTNFYVETEEDGNAIYYKITAYANFDVLQDYIASLPIFSN